MTQSPTPPITGAEGLPIVATCVRWNARGDNDMDWLDWYSDGEPVPTVWDDVEPDEILELTPHAPAQALIDELKHELEVTRGVGKNLFSASQELLQQVDSLRSENERLSRELEEAREEIAVDDKLLAEQYRLMDAIPGCPIHGNRCVPHAVEWVKRQGGGHG